MHALAQAYADGAREGGHETRLIRLAELDFPLLRRNEDFQSGRAPPAIARCQEDLRWANHLLLVFPLWLGSSPALLKGFLEQLLRPGFAFGETTGRGLPPRLLKGRSARVVVTMGMPGFFYRWFYRAHGVKSLERNILAFCGIGPIGTTLIGMVGAAAGTHRERALRHLRRLGRNGT